VTYEWEGVPAEAARTLEPRLPVRPGPRPLAVSQDRLTEKETFARLGIGVPGFAAVDDRASLDDALDAVLKGPGLKPHFVRFFADHFPEAKISVIVADRKAPESLYGMFGEATGIPLATPRTAKELVANRSLGLIEAKILSSFNAGAKEASLTLENYRKARSLLRNQFESEGWRAVVPMIPLTLPSDWVGPLRTLSTATIADIKELEAKGRITVFGDIESLDDLEPCPEESDTPRDGKEPA